MTAFDRAFISELRKLGALSEEALGKVQALTAKQVPTPQRAEILRRFQQGGVAQATSGQVMGLRGETPWTERALRQMSQAPPPSDGTKALTQLGELGRAQQVHYTPLAKAKKSPTWGAGD